MLEAFHGAIHDNCFLLAKAASYSAALSLFPGLILLADTHVASCFRLSKDFSLAENIGPIYRQVKHQFRRRH